MPQQTSSPTNSSSGPQDHSSLVGGSTAARRIGCAASYQLEQQVPPHIRNQSSSYADEGSALHACMEHILSENLTVDDLDEHILGREFGDPPYVMTVDRVNKAIVPCLDFVDALIEELEDEGEFRFELELKCEMPGIPGAFGTSDLVFRTDKRSGIIDWKFGEGVPVAAEYEVKDSDGETVFDEIEGKLVPRMEGNKQLLFYARAAQHSYPDMFGDGDDWPVDLYIVQPRSRDGFSSTKHETDAYGLEEFRQELIAAVERNKMLNPQPTRGPWCTFAACKTKCSLYTGALLDMSKLGAIKRAKPDEPLSISDYGDQLHLLMEAADVAQLAIDEIMKQAYRHLEEGGQILDSSGEPAWKLVPKRGTEKYVDEQGAMRHAVGLGVPVEKAMQPRVLKSPAQLSEEIEPLLDKKEFKTKKDRMAEARRQIAEFTLTSSSGNTLARASDKRPDAIASPQLVETLASKLALLQK